MKRPQRQVKDSAVQRPEQESEERVRLSDLCGDMFTLIMQLYVTRELDDAEMLRRRIKDQLSRLERSAKDAGYEAEEIQNATFALIAFIDEVINSSNWSQKDLWLANPLQLELFNRNDAGDEFFTRLDHLRKRAQANAEVLEVYYLSLVLGFKGRYQFHETDRLRHLIQDTEQDLRRARVERSVEFLSPNGLPRDTLVDVVKEEIPLWVIGVVAAAIAFVFFLIMTLMIGGAANDVVAKIQNTI